MGCDSISFPVEIFISSAVNICLTFFYTNHSFILSLPTKSETFLLNNFKCNMYLVCLIFFPSLEIPFQLPPAFCCFGLGFPSPCVAVCHPGTLLFCFGSPVCSSSFLSHYFCCSFILLRHIHPTAFWERCTGGEFFETLLSFILLSRLMDILAKGRILGWK